MKEMRLVWPTVLPQGKTWSF